MDTSVTKIKAKDKVRFLMVLLVSGSILGGIYEYHMAEFPLDEVNVIYVAPEMTAKNDAKNSEAEAQTKSVNNEETAKAEDKEKSEVVLKAQETQKNTEVTDHPQALNEFLGEMREIRARVDDIKVGGTILERLKQPESSVNTAETSNKQPFEEGKIEIYDSEKGVVEVIEEPAQPVAEKAAERNETAENGTDSTMVENAVGAVGEGEKTEIDNSLNTEENDLRQQLNVVNEQSQEVDEDAPIMLLPGIVTETSEKSVAE